MPYADQTNNKKN